MRYIFVGPKSDGDALTETMIVFDLLLQYHDKYHHTRINEGQIILVFFFKQYNYGRAGPERLNLWELMICFFLINTYRVIMRSRYGFFFYNKLLESGCCFVYASPF